MKLRILTLLLLLGLGLNAQTTTFTLSVNVYFGIGSDGQNPEPAPFYPFMIDIGQIMVNASTDANGFFEVDIDIPDDAPDDAFLVVSAFDICTGLLVSVDVPLTGTGGNAELTVCSGVDPPPYPETCEAFFIYETTVSNPLMAQFTDLSYPADSIDNWAWDFGDGTTSNESDPMHTYDEPGVYVVSLTIVSGDCTSTIELDVSIGVDPPCDCDDILDPVCVLTPAGNVLTFPNACFAICEGYGPDSFFPCDGGDQVCNAFFTTEPLDQLLAYSFLDLSFVLQGEIESWTWDFGDGTTSDEQNPQHVFSAAGIYEVSLTITTSSGCTSTYTQLVNLFDEDDCNCDDVYDPVCVAITTTIVVEFPNLCTAECAGFGLDQVVDCNNNDCDCPEFYDPVCVEENGTIITFDNFCFAECEGYGPDQYFDCDGDPCNCDLDEYDPVCVLTAAGGIISFPNPCYAQCEGFGPDDFVDCDDDCDCPDIFAPVCVTTDDGTILTFSNACYAQCDGYGPDDYMDCNIDNPCDCELVIDPVCVATAAGVMVFPNACLAECEGFGPDSYLEDCFDGGYDGDCLANFYTEYINDNGFTVQFFDESYVAEGEIVSWFWEFGDGTTSDEQNPIHEYQEEGIFEVSFAIETSEGCTSTVTYHVVIGDGGVFEGPDCQAMFFFEQVTDNPLTFEFFDMSIGDVESYQWDFGDGSTSTEANPVHTFAEAGVYIVTLTINDGDCESNVGMVLVTDEDILYDNACTALFLPFINPDSSGQVFFLNLSSLDAVYYSWDFGDGTTSNEFIPIHEYEFSGIFEITLTITTVDGCTNTFSVTLDLELENFTGNPTYLMINDTEEEIALAEARLFPNPVNEQALLTFEMASPEPYRLSVLTLTGQEITSQNGKTVRGNNQMVVDVADLPSGLYLLRLWAGDHTRTFKMIVE